MFEKSTIAPVSLTNWLDWCAGNSDEQYIVLPLIQRGSVWKPGQIIDLWDSLLRGLPVGSFMTNRIDGKSGTLVRLPGQKESRLLDRDAYGLLDGQQRTLAMLSGWPKQQGMDRRIWVDFADAPGKEHLFRLRVTTENHPFGFQRESPSSKLSVDERRRATLVYRKQYSLAESSNDFPDFRKARPFHAGRSLAVDLVELIAWYNECRSNRILWVDKVNEALQSVVNYQVQRDAQSNLLEAVEVERKAMDELRSSAEVHKRIEAFYEALTRIDQLQVPLILIDMDKVESTSQEGDEDPALAILFKRVGSNGTPLSNADYIFSVIKHNCPMTHDLVEKIHSPEDAARREYNIAALLTPTDIVGTAVRLAAANCLDDQKKPLVDSESIDKNQFSRLLRTEVTVGGKKGNFLNDAFMPFIDGQDPRGLAPLFDGLAARLRYRGAGDKGLPSHALWLLNRPLIQVLLFWMRQFGTAQDVTNDERLDVIRFVMFWSLCVTDRNKASQLAFSIIRQPDGIPAGTSVFHVIYKQVVEKDYALRLLSPQSLEAVIPDVIQLKTDDPRPLLGWTRFAVKPDEADKRRRAIALYQKWWSSGSFHHYSHPLLLWLQRDYVAGLPGSPVAGREEDTPYDYDHILPKSHWGDWRGISGNERLMDFILKSEEQSHYVLGNSIGNVRVWSSADNRSDGADSPKVKLDRGECELNLNNSAICKEHYSLWEACSADGELSLKWNLGRAVDFQQAVERRSFSLYKSFYDDLAFNNWTD